jgi:hypothetical protein
MQQVPSSFVPSAPQAFQPVYNTAVTAPADTVRTVAIALLVDRALSA